MALSWMRNIWRENRDENGRRVYRQWISSQGEVSAKDRAAELRERVISFKDETLRRGIGFPTDRDAWEAFWEKYPNAHMDFAGTSTDQALAEYALQQFRRIWSSQRHKHVEFEGDGVIQDAPTVVTLGAGDHQVRGDVIEVLKSDDEAQRALAIEDIEAERLHIRAVLRGRAKRLVYLNKVQMALASGARAIERDGKVYVQGVLAAPMFDPVLEELAEAGVDVAVDDESDDAGASLEVGDDSDGE